MLLEPLVPHLSEAQFRCTQHLSWCDRSNLFLFSSFLLFLFFLFMVGYLDL